MANNENLELEEQLLMLPIGSSMTSVQYYGSSAQQVRQGEK